MFLIRRVFRVKRGEVRQVCEILKAIGDKYEAAGQRQPSRIYHSGYTTPGPQNTVYMEWIDAEIKSIFRDDNPSPEGIDELFAQLHLKEEETWIEFHELFSGE
ncbi:MAG: hypothetical protein MK127_00450 [Dehalococcoidia bacterium]|jgi:hypothetical protein|nr:hypothetical protein [Dehalococcoidia bacterium]|tara:strand:- start:131 stop:439 length:309 start_codon:yes stop_codon:yes gene_type:complete